jgi:tetratricopeptide (TPR) repeat protein
VHKVNDSYRPIPLIFTAIEYQIFGLNPTISHINNILLHGLNAFLIFLFLFHLFKKKTIWLALSIAIFFAIHPIHIEVVSNIKGRDDILAFMGIITTLLFLQNWLHNKKTHFLILSVFCSLGAILSKEPSIFIAGVIPLYLYFFTTFNWRKIIFASLPFLVIAVGYLIIRSHAFDAVGLQHVNSIDNPLIRTGGSEFVLNLLTVWGTMIQKLVLPLTFICDYSFSTIQPSDLFYIRPVVGLVAPILFVYVALKGLKSRTLISFASLFFLGSILLYSHLLFKYINIFAERSMYSPSFPFILLVGLGIYWFISKGQLEDQRITKTSRFKMTRAVLGILAAVYVLMTLVRGPEWKNDSSLFLSDVAKAPDNIRLNLLAGTLFIDEAISKNISSGNEVSKAEEHLLKVQSLEPELARTYLQLGNVYKIKKDFATAQNYYEEAIKRGDEGNPAIYFNMGFLAQSLGDHKTAEDHYNHALDLFPNYVPALVNLGINYGMQNNKAKSIEYLNKALQLDPDDELAIQNLQFAKTLK